MKGYKSFAFFIFALGIAVANFFGFAEFSMTAEQQEVFTVVVPLIGLILRYVTTSAVFSAE